MRYLRNASLLAGMLAVQITAPAADLDVFSTGPNMYAVNLPNVLFVIDNTANWNTAFANEMRALSSTLANMPSNKFNVGIMLQTEMGGNNQGPAGGYIRAGIRTLNDTNRPLYVNLINSLDKLADKGSAGTSGLAMAEAYHYLKGLAPYSGARKTKADFTGNVRVSPASDALYNLGGNALDSFAATRYSAPMGGDCTHNYIIYISNGPNQQSSSANATANNLLNTAAGGGSAGAAAVSQISLYPSSSQSNPIDEWTRFMRKSSLAVTTYTIDVDPSATAQGQGWTALLKSMSGPENYTAVSSTGSVQIDRAINDVLSKMLSINSVFAPVGLPASPDVPGAYLNQLYVGMFRPDPNIKLRWMGNLKQYRMGYDSSLIDADGRWLLSSQTGFVNECTRSYWSLTTPDNYWANAPMGYCIAPGSNPDLYAMSNSPDGEIVEKGGMAYILRQANPATRNVMTCAPSQHGCTSLLHFNSSVVTAEALGAANIAERDSLIAWAKGGNPNAELGKNPLEMRPSAHGDVIHSNPLPLSYTSNWGYGNNVVVYYGSNDGMLHAINGNRDQPFGDTPAGGELWAFMPPEFIPKLKRLRSNDERMSVTPAFNGTAYGTEKPYSIDGPLTSYRDNGNTWLFAAMRRGGRSLYAFDVSNPTQPSLKWKLGCAPDGLDCTVGAGGMGQTWGTALPIKARNAGMPAAPLLIMGGGYDNCEDADVNTCGPSANGNKIYVIDANSGAIVKAFDTERGVIGEVTVVADEEGYAAVGYAADLGGNVYRINMGNASASNWSVTKIAALGCDSAYVRCTSNRKFMFGPSVVVEADGSYSLYLGSGDREKPLGSNTFPRTSMVENYFFKLQDKPGDSTWLAMEAANCGGEVICMASLNSTGNVAGTCGAFAAPGGKGWKLGLRPTEQIVTLAATRFGVTTFSTHTPDVQPVDSCSARLGRVNVYNLYTATAEPANGTTCSDQVYGGNLPSAPRKLDVCMDAACTDKRPICIGCSKESSIQTQETRVPPSSVSPAAKAGSGWTLQ